MYEEMLSICSLKFKLQEQIFFQSFIHIKGESQLDMKKFFSIMIEGAPAKLGQNSAFIKILKQETDIFLLITLFYYMIHIE